MKPEGMSDARAASSGAWLIFWEQTAIGSSDHLVGDRRQHREPERHESAAART